VQANILRASGYHYYLPILERGEVREDYIKNWLFKQVLLTAALGMEDGPKIKILMTGYHPSLSSWLHLRFVLVLFYDLVVSY
jgi:hypothetical protein